MGCSTRRALALTLLALAAQGCITGHLLDTARRVERPSAYQDACVDGDRLLLRYTATITDHFGQPLGHRERRVAIALAHLQRADVPVEAFPFDDIADATLRCGQPVAFHVAGGPVPLPPLLDVENGPDGRPARLILHDAQGGAYAPLYSSALTRTRTARWVYPLLPLSLAFDAATNPVLLFFAPAVIVVGE